MRHPFSLISVLLAFAAVVLTAESVGAARPLSIGFGAGEYLSQPPEQTVWFDRTSQAGAQVVRIAISWASIAPDQRAHGFNASDPGAPGYRWATLDSSIRAAAVRHLDVVLAITGGAPLWAQGPHPPSNVVRGTWRPSAKALGGFARAAALRYSGRFPDPLHPGAVLPRVRKWQIWNEPNLNVYLAPQWTRRGRSFVATSPIVYRNMLNAAYASIKSVHRDNLVATAGTGPYGDLSPGQARIQPVEFVRDLVCLKGRRLRPVRCAHPAHFDVLAHHPYGIRGPLSHALNPDDVAVPDLGKLTRVLRAARKSGRVQPRGPKQLWVTEISWDSNPPDPQGVPIETESRWLEQSFYVLWRQGVSLITWFNIRDQDASQGFEFSNQSGVYLRDGTPKLSLQAFEFPFVMDRRGGGTIAWGRAPTAGTVQIQRMSGSGFVTVSTVGVRRLQVFSTTLKNAPAGTYRAVDGGATSLTWQLP